MMLVNKAINKAIFTCRACRGAGCTSIMRSFNHSRDGGPLGSWRQEHACLQPIRLNLPGLPNPCLRYHLQIRPAPVLAPYQIVLAPPRCLLPIEDRLCSSQAFDTVLHSSCFECAVQFAERVCCRARGHSTRPMPAALACKQSCCTTCSRGRRVRCRAEIQPFEVASGLSLHV
jgi:hypothetical protein